MNKIIVTGGRNYKDYEVVKSALDWAASEFAAQEVVIGGSGGDALAKRWAKESGMWVTTFKPLWHIFKGQAGQLRNVLMVNGNKDAKCLIAFPGGKTVTNCIGCALSVGIKCFQVDKDEEGRIKITEVSLAR